MMHSLVGKRNRDPFDYRDWEGEKYVRSVLKTLESLRWLLKGNSKGVGDLNEFSSGLEKIIEIMDHCPKPFGPLGEEPSGAILYIKRGFARSLSSLMQTLVYTQTKNESPAGVPWLEKWSDFRLDLSRMLILAKNYGTNKDARAPGWTDDDPLEAIRETTKSEDFVLKIVEEWQVKLQWENQ